MQVLIKNPFFKSHLTTQHLIESFWSPHCLYPNENFALSSLMDLSDPLGFSPYLLIDARIAFATSQLVPGKSCYARQIGALGVLAAYFQTLGIFGHEEDDKKISLFQKEYLPQELQNFISPQTTYEQVIVFGESMIDLQLWSKLKVGGFFILASDKTAITVNLAPEDFEAFGKLWPFGEPTEFGWRFKEAQWGLQNFNFMKIKKLR